MTVPSVVVVGVAVGVVGTTGVTVGSPVTVSCNPVETPVSVGTSDNVGASDNIALTDCWTIGLTPELSSAGYITGGFNEGKRSRISSSVSGGSTGSKGLLPCMFGG